MISLIKEGLPDVYIKSDGTLVKDCSNQPYCTTKQKVYKRKYGSQTYVILGKIVNAEKLRHKYYGTPSVAQDIAKISKQFELHGKALRPVINTTNYYCTSDARLFSRKRGSNGFRELFGTHAVSVHTKKYWRWSITDYDQPVQDAHVVFARTWHDKIENISGKPYNSADVDVAHINDQTTREHCRLDGLLIFCSRSQNLIQATYNGRRKKQLMPDVVMSIMTDYLNGKTAKQLAKQHKQKYTVIASILAGRLFQYVGAPQFRQQVYDAYKARNYREKYLTTRKLKWRKAAPKVQALSARGFSNYKIAKDAWYASNQRLSYM